MIRRLIILTSILLAIAFATLLERKVLGLGQGRQGPTQVASFGLLQPFSDGLKLISKGEILWNKRVGIIWAPGFMFFLMLIF